MENHKFINFTAVLSIGFILDFLICMFFLSYFNFGISISVISGFFFGTFFNFFFIQKYVFKFNGKKLYSLIAYTMMMMLIVILRVCIVYFLNFLFLERWIYLSIIFASLITLFINFIASNYYIFVNKK